MRPPLPSSKKKQHGTADMLVSFTLAVALLPAIWGFGIWTFMTIWNWFVPDLTGWKPMTFWAAAGIFVLKTLILLHVAREENKTENTHKTLIGHVLANSFGEISTIAFILFWAWLAHHFLVG